MNDDWTGRRTAPRVASASRSGRGPHPRDGRRPDLASGKRLRLNVPIGLARLGLDASYAGRLSTDVFGRLLELRLADEGVDVSLIMRGVERTALAIVGRAGDEAIYDFRWSDTADRSYNTAG